MIDRQIVGHCPACGGTTLFIGTGGHITCSLISCPRPTAVDELLVEQETEHVVLFDEHTFTVRHPLRERLDDQLMTCNLHKTIADRSGPPAQPGRYRVTWTEGRWWYHKLAEVTP